MKIKKGIAFMAALCVTLGTTVLAACGGNDNKDNSSSSSATTSSSSSEESNSFVDSSSSEEQEAPLGTVNNPHYCYYWTDEETGEPSATMYVPTIKAHSAEYYAVVRSANNFICVKQANVKIVYNGQTYDAKDGDIEFQSAGEAGNTFYAATIQIVNDTDADIELVMTFKEVAVE